MSKSRTSSTSCSANFYVAAGSGSGVLTADGNWPLGPATTTGQIFFDGSSDTDSNGVSHLSVGGGHDFI